MATLWNLSRLNNTIGTLVGGTWNHAFGYNTMGHKQIYKYIPKNWVRTSGVRPPYTPSMPIKDGWLSFYGHDITTTESVIGNLWYYSTAIDIVSTSETAALWLIVSIYATDTVTTSESWAISGTLLLVLQDTVSTSETVFGGAIVGIQLQDNVIIGETVQLGGLGNMVMKDWFPEWLTPEGIRFAVWSSLATDNNITGSMGAKLNSAASWGVDYNALAQAVWEYSIRSLTTSWWLTPEQAQQLSDSIKITDSLLNTGKIILPLR